MHLCCILFPLNCLSVSEAPLIRHRACFKFCTAIQVIFLTIFFNTGPDPPTWLQAVSSRLWHNAAWSSRIFITDGCFPGSATPLHQHFQKLTAKACSICDLQAERPFGHNAELADHMTTKHSQCLCMVCLEVRKFLPCVTALAFAKRCGKSFGCTIIINFIHAISAYYSQ